MGVFQRFEEDLRRTGLGRFSPIATHDEAYRQIPFNLTTAIRKQWFDKVVVYARTGERQIAPYHIHETNASDNQADVGPMFATARQPLFGQEFYHQQWSQIAQLARQRGETNADYLRQIDGFIRQFAA